MVTSPQAYFNFFQQLRVTEELWRTLDVLLRLGFTLQVREDGDLDVFPNSAPAPIARVKVATGMVWPALLRTAESAEGA